jgi:uncharacterized membrane protein
MILANATYMVLANATYTVLANATYMVLANATYKWLWPNPVDCNACLWTSAGSSPGSKSLKESAYFQQNGCGA